MQKIILATSSPYRQEAFGFLGLDFVAEASEVDEKFIGRPKKPESLVLKLAKLKAEAVARNYKKGIVIGFDSVGWYKNKILEKPESRNEAFKRLRSLSNNSSYFYTGIQIIDILTKKSIAKVIKTKIFFRNLSNTEINKYLNQDSNYTTYAHGYDPLGHYSSSFVKKIEGSYNNFIRGIPLETIIIMLKEIGYKII